MLAALTAWLAEIGRSVTVVGRDWTKLQAVAAKHPDIHPLKADYTDGEQWERDLLNAVESRGRFDEIVAWIHGDPAGVISTVRRVNDQRAKSIYHVLGSSSDLEAIRQSLALPDDVRYCRIQLGFKMGNGTSRWLTDLEISEGIIESIAHRKDVLIGQLEPWEDRPG